MTIQWCQQDSNTPDLCWDPFSLNQLHALRKYAQAGQRNLSNNLVCCSEHAGKGLLQDSHLLKKLETMQQTWPAHQINWLTHMVT
jgi:hypothetical protein